MPNPKAPAETFDARMVRELAAILNDTGLSEIEVARGDLKIRVAKTLSGAPMLTSPMTFSAAQTPPAAGPQAALAEPTRIGEAVKSPMVGTVYMAAQPGAAPFIKVGDKVTEGQTLLIVEAMKTMNPIPSPRAGTVIELLARDGQPVEFGEGLLVLE